MKNIATVTAKLYLIFIDYKAGNIGEEKFVDELKKICKGKGNQSYWWRFFKDDTAANDWLSVSNSFDSYRNTQYLKECIDICIEQQGLTVYYS